VTENLAKLEQQLGHTFTNKNLLSLALTHRSYHKTNNERLEYLGDAILGFVIAEALYHKFPEQSEGDLTRLRASLVKGETLAKLAKEIELGEFIILGTGEMKSGGWRRQSILSNTLEALIGAIHIDAGISASSGFISRIYEEMLETLSPSDINKDPKTKLQEFLQARNEKLPVYKVIDEQGEAHKREFKVECFIDYLEDKIIAEGRSKRSAEQSAAEKVLLILDEKKKSKGSL
jgi:ribonuclease-3